MQPATPDNTRQPQKGQGIMSGIIGDVAQTVRQLVREELQIAKNQMSDKALDVATDAGMIAAGGVVAYAGYLTIISGIVDGMEALGMPRWLAGVAVGSTTLAGGTAIILRGLDNLQMKESVVEGAKEQMSEAVDDLEKEMD